MPSLVVYSSREDNDNDNSLARSERISYSKLAYDLYVFHGVHALQTKLTTSTFRRQVTTC